MSPSASNTQFAVRLLYHSAVAQVKNDIMQLAYSTESFIIYHSILFGMHSGKLKEIVLVSPQLNFNSKFFRLWEKKGKVFQHFCYFHALIALR